MIILYAALLIMNIGLIFLFKIYNAPTRYFIFPIIAIICWSMLIYGKLIKL